MQNIVLTHAQFMLLTNIYWMYLYGTVAILVALTNHTKMEIMQISQLLKILEKNILIERSNNQKDSQSNTVQLTDLGIKRPSCSNICLCVIQLSKLK